MGDMRCELAIMDTGNHIGIVEDIQQFLLDIAVIYVDRHRPNFKAGQHTLEVFIAVIQVQANMITRPDTLLCQVMGQLVGASIQLRKTESLIPANQSGSVRHLVCHLFKQIRDIKMVFCHGLFMLH